MLANSPVSFDASQPQTPAFPFRRLYRAHIGAVDCRTPERTAFVEASCHHGAVRKIAHAVAALEMRDFEAVEDRIYNCHSAQELIDDGLSEDVELRLFETGWCGTAVSFVEEPLFLMAASALIKKWAQISTHANKSFR